MYGESMEVLEDIIDLLVCKKGERKNVPGASTPIVNASVSASSTCE